MFGTIMSNIAERHGFRLAVGFACGIAALLLYAPAEAAGTAFHDFYRHFSHPWGEVLNSVAILTFSVAACVSVFPVLRRGSAMLRFLALIVIASPVLILTRFLLWAGYQWSAQ